MILNSHLIFLQNAQFSSLDQISYFISKNLSKLREFDAEIFNHLFASNKTILIWDGVDEISPVYKTFKIFIELIEKISQSSKNQQFIGTRPEKDQRLENKFQVSVHKLVPYSFDERKELITKYLKSKNNSTIAKVEKFIADREKESHQSVNTPILIILIADAAADSDADEIFKNNYKLYERFVDKRIKILSDKGKTIIDKVFSMNYAASMKMMHQVYAMKVIALSTLFDVDVKDLLIFKHVNQSITLTSEDISKIGIVVANSYDVTDFIHRTFAEFFIAQFLIENVYNSNFIFANDKNEEILRVKLLLNALTVNPSRNNLDVVRNFMFEYLKINQKLGNNSTRYLMMNDFSKSVYDLDPEEMHPKFIYEFFKKDSEISNKIGSIQKWMSVKYKITSNNINAPDEDIWKSYEENHQKGKILYQCWTLKVGLCKLIFEATKIPSSESYFKTLKNESMR